MVRKTIAFLVYNDMELLDMAGSQTAFYEASQYAKESYSVEVVGFDEQLVVSEAGTQIQPNTTIDALQDCHTLVIPGGKGARHNLLTADSVAKLRQLMARCQRVVSICTGAFLLAETGLPKGTQVATHWAFVEELAKRFPELQVDKKSLYVEDGKYWSSAGVTACIDLTLRLIELDLGIKAAMHVAQHMVVYLKRTGSQQQYSDFLSLQTPSDERLISIVNWLKHNLDKQITVEMIADKAHMSERQLHRSFVKEVGKPPAHYLEELRMDLARTLLVSSDENLKKIALSVGYRSYDGFKRAFERNFSISPLRYRQAFTAK
ncbi:GlxA family transcriptional regulator [Kangiella aquimarina]|uniref:DJ-1/PfpI family protein n=1 Tax=Kangiella aquimarina TaxID=261965 RepID=A0ABZ0X5F6_9GAMM|nr:helix-turn-helix domain-containing protein [Kangiella aquimarina]WQG85823.1 DJ-1/PfpI family protein [Kangiella aquimarina]